MSPKTPIQQLDPETLQIVGTHASISDAARALGMVPSAINMAVNKGFVSGGYRWRPIPEADLPPRGPPVYKRTAAPVVKRAAAPPPLPAAASVSGSSQGRVLMKKPAMFREDVDEPMVRAPQVVKKPAMFKEMVEEDEEDEEAEEGEEEEQEEAEEEEEGEEEAEDEVDDEEEEEAEEAPVMKKPALMKKPVAALEDSRPDPPRVPEAYLSGGYGVKKKPAAKKKMALRYDYEAAEMGVDGGVAEQKAGSLKRRR